MSKLFVANCTRQHQEIHFRLDINSEGNQEQNARFQPAKRMTIPPGRQVPLGGDLHITQVTDIIDQLRRFGLVGTVGVPRLKTMAPFVCSIDKAVPESIIRQVMDSNAGILIREGQERRKRAAVAMNETVANAVAEKFAAEGIPSEAKQDVEIEIEQVEQSEAGEKRIEEGFRIKADAPSQDGSGRRARRQRNK